MTELSDKSNLPEIFRNCDDRVFAFGRDKLPHKDKPINAIKYSRLKYIIDKLEGEYFKQRPFNGFKLARYFLDKVRKYQIDGVQYVWPYESRWETNETLGKELGGFTEPMTYRQIRTAFDQAKHYGLIHNPASQGDRLRLFRLHDDLIAMAKMTDQQIGQYIISQNKHRPQKSKYIDRRSRSTSTAEVEVHRPQKSIELNNESNQEYNNLIKQPPSGYPQADGHMTEYQYDELATSDIVNPMEDHPGDPSYHSDRVLNDLDKNDMDLDQMTIHKRDIITAWRREFYQTTNGKAYYRYFGGNFFDIFYCDLSDYLRAQGHNKRVLLIEKLGLEIFGHIVFGEADNPYKISFDSHQNAGHSCALNYLKTNNFKILKEAAYAAIDKPEPNEVIPTSLKPETPLTERIQSILAKMKGMEMLKHQAKSFAVEFDKNFSKQMTRLKIDNHSATQILFDVLDDKDSWNFVLTLWRNQSTRDSLWKDSSMQSLIKKTKTYQSIMEVKKEKGAQELIDMVTRSNAKRPKGQHIYYEGAAN